MIQHEPLANSRAARSAAEQFREPVQQIGMYRLVLNRNTPEEEA